LGKRAPRNGSNRKGEGVKTTASGSRALQAEWQDVGAGRGGWCLAIQQRRVEVNIQNEGENGWGPKRLGLDEFDGTVPAKVRWVVRLTLYC